MDPTFTPKAEASDDYVVKAARYSGSREGGASWAPPPTPGCRPKQRSADQVVASGSAIAVAPGSHAQYNGTTTSPADSEIERVRRSREVVDLPDRNPDLATAELLGHAREPAPVSLHVDIDNRHPARRRRRRAGDRGQPPAVGDGGEGSGLTPRGRVDRCSHTAATRPVADFGG